MSNDKQEYVRTIQSGGKVGGLLSRGDYEAIKEFLLQFMESDSGFHSIRYWKKVVSGLVISLKSRLHGISTT